MRERCGDLPPAECDARVEEAKRLALDAGVSAHLLFPDTTRRGLARLRAVPRLLQAHARAAAAQSVQYTMALSNFDEPEPDGSPLRFRYGFIASSDNHKARPGTGYKQYERRRMTEAHRPALRVLPERVPARPARAAARAIRSAARLDAPAGSPGPARARHRARRELPVSGRPGGGALRGAHARADLGRARAARGVRHERPAPAALVRPAERAGRAGADGRRREPRPGAALRGARRRRADAEARLPGVRPRRRSAPSGSSICAAASATTRATSATRSSRSRSCASARSSRKGEADRSADRGSVAALRVRARSERLRRRLRRSRVRRRRTRRPLLRARAPGSDAGRERREPAHRVRRRRQGGARPRPASATTARPSTTTASLPCRSAPGPRRSSSISRAEPSPRAGSFHQFARLPLAARG